LRRYNGAVFTRQASGRLIATLALAGASLVAAQAQPPPPGPPPLKDEPIRCEFRVFDGEAEVTSESMVRIFPTGVREGGILITPSSGRLMIHVAPAIYDAQIVRQKQGQVSNIRWADQLVVMRYPDEGGEHLEVINFKPRFGALQIVGRDAANLDVAAFVPADPRSAGGERRPVGRAQTGPGYQLFVLPAGRYDVRIRRPSDVGERWLLDVEVPADRTRLKSADGSD
jgi:hypothetical protein